jgi:hypothetical protein
VPIGNDDVANKSVRDGATDEGYILHACEAQVSNELTAPAHQALVFLAEYACADPLSRHSNRSSPIKIATRRRVSAATRAFASEIL